MRGLKILISTTALLVGLALTPPAHAQVSIQHWRSTRLFLWLLRLCALRLRTGGVLRIGLFLQRYLRGHGSMVRLGL